MFTKALATLIIGLGAQGFACATDIDAYRPVNKVSGEIRIWGSPQDRGLIDQLGKSFGMFHPEVRFSTALHGPDSTLAGVYAGVADIAFMARELRLPMESMAYEWVLQYQPFSVEIANGGLTADRPSAQLAVFVHKDNPLTRITMTELDGVISAEHKRGGRNVRTWGELGLDGDWDKRPINVFGPSIDSIPALFIRTTVMQGSRKWNPDYREFPGGGQEAIKTLESDRAGMAIAPQGSATANVKALAIGESKTAAFHQASRQTIVERIYPLARNIAVVINRAPGKPIDAKVKEFLRFVLSGDGQAIVARDGAYLPLSAATASRQLARLE